MKKALSISAIIFGGILILTAGILATMLLAGIVGGEHRQSTPHSRTTGQAHPSPKIKEAIHAPADDVNLIGILRDQGQNTGAPSAQVDYKITNHSKETRDYTLTFGLYNHNKERVEEDMQFVDNVAPGETVKPQATAFYVGDGFEQNPAANITEVKLLTAEAI